MDIRSVLKVAEIKLVKANFPSPALEAEILLSAVLGKNKEYLFSHPEEKVSIWQNFIFQRIINKRLAGYSSAVLVGHKWFYGLDFVVNKNVLVPRPETELMVDEVIKIIKSESLKIKNIVDVGTGSGCIIVSLAKNTRKIGVDLELYGLDISKKALKIARINAKKNNVDSCTHFLYSNLLNNIDKKIFNEPVLITANLPYLTSEQVKNSPTIQK
jgi:release factor glutamine methyltransferase